jgi:hypothetical protein
MVPITITMTTDITEIPIILMVMSGANTIRVVRNGENMVNNMEEENNTTDERNPPSVVLIETQADGGFFVFEMGGHLGSEPCPEFVGMCLRKANATNWSHSVYNRTNFFSDICGSISKLTHDFRNIRGYTPGRYQLRYRVGLHRLFIIRG